MSKQFTLRVMAEYGSSGIWVDGSVGHFRHGMVEHAAFPLPEDLSNDFDAWIDQYWNHKGWDKAQADKFNQQGRALAVRLKAWLGDRGIVLYQPETWPSGLGSEEVIP